MAGAFFPPLYLTKILFYSFIEHFGANMKMPSLGLLMTVATLTVVGLTGAALTYKDEYFVRKHIKEWAIDPDSVVVRNLKQSKRDKEVWCGQVNARNRFGGMVGFQHFVFQLPGVTKLTGPDDIDVIFRKMTLEDQDTFLSANRLFCEQ